MSDTLANGQSVRILTILDVCTRESIAIRVDSRFSANKVVKLLEEVAMDRGKPNSIRVDNGPKFTGSWILADLVSQQIMRSLNHSTRGCVRNA